MMRKCQAPECQREERVPGAGETLYKFPLNDKVRLKQWLINMGRESLVPTRQHRLCSKHFKPSCYQSRSGARLLKQDAVPTVFESSGNVPMKKDVSRRRKSPCAETIVQQDLSISSLPGSSILQLSSSTDILGGETSAGAQALAPPSRHIAEGNLVPIVHFVNSFDGLSLALSASPSVSAMMVPGNSSLAEAMTLVPEQQSASSLLQCDLDSSSVLSGGGHALLALSQTPGALVMENISIDPVCPSIAPAQMSSAELVTYIEMMQAATAVPSMLEGPLPPLMPTPETILSSAITRPIPSTVPIVSKHARTEALSERAGQSGLAEGLSTAQLVSLVVELQKKVKTMQQRHRRHSSKLEVMEGVVDQLRREDLVSDEKLGLLEVACVQPGPELPEGVRTVTIVCEEEEQGMMYTLQNEAVFHAEEQ